MNHETAAEASSASFLRIQAAGPIGIPDMRSPLPKEPSAPTSQELVAERGHVHLRLGEFKEAEECYRRVLAAEPLRSDVLINLGFVLKELSRPSESATLLDRALSASPENAD